MIRALPHSLSAKDWQVCLFSSTKWTYNDNDQLNFKRNCSLIQKSFLQWQMKLQIFRIWSKLSFAYVMWMKIPNHMKILGFMQLTLLNQMCLLMFSRIQCYGWTGAWMIAEVNPDMFAWITCHIYHCYGHAFNLAIGDTIKGNKMLRETHDTT